MHQYNTNSRYMVHNSSSSSSPPRNSKDVHTNYSTDGEESVRTCSEYAVAHKPNSVIKIVVPPHSSRKTTYDNHLGDLSRESPLGNPSQNGSETNVPIFMTNGYRTTSELSRGSRQSPVSSSRIDDRPPSHYSCDSARSRGSTVKTKTSRHGGIVIETMSTPNPFCPNTKGMCCLMLLINLGLILVTLGFVIVIQFFQPLIVWILGIIFLIFGFLTLIGSLIYCVQVCSRVQPNEINPEDFYWTRYWQGHIGTAQPEIHYKAEEKYPNDDYANYATNYSDRRSNRY